MSNFEQNYNFNYLHEPPNNNSGSKEVKIITIIWGICVALEVLIAVFSWIFYDDVITAAVWVRRNLYCAEAFCIISHHIVSIIGKIKYRKNVEMQDIFEADMVMLVVLVIIIICIESINMTCDGCG